MWQIYALVSLVASAFDSVTDKAALVADRKIDYAVATFWRLTIFTAVTIAIGYSGWVGSLSFVFTPAIMLLALFTIINSLCYTYLLRTIEVTGIAAAYYLAPFLFLAIDMYALHTNLSAPEVAGIILLVLGGLGFAVDGRTHHFKKELSFFVWLMLGWMIIYTGFDAYLFKYMNATDGVSPVSFAASYAIAATIGLFLVIIYQQKTHLLFKRSAQRYFPYIVISKTFDAICTLTWTQALVFAAVSQVSAMEALEPLVLFVITVLVQEVLRFRVGENLGARRFRWKAVSVSLLVIGGLLVT